MKTSFLLIAGLFFAGSLFADVKDLKDATEFEDLVKKANVPVIVQFYASWCGPCHQLQAVLKKVAPSYNDDQVIIAMVDADLNKSLRKYLKGGYPTVRTFAHGELAEPSFVGSQSESFVRNFISKVLNMFFY